MIIGKHTESIRENIRGLIKRNRKISDLLGKPGLIKLASDKDFRGPETN
jgi:hypothetical protein